MNRSELINNRPQYAYNVKMLLADRQIHEIGFHYLEEALLAARVNSEYNVEFLKLYTKN
ncbi:MAG: hypothetical protein LBI13_07995 [Streptococcaceae bacterium]|jgi:hypothetical protein|nr:hypothetical protein [Streptococcaceae bacterium]